MIPSSPVFSNGINSLEDVAGGVNVASDFTAISARVPLPMLAMFSDLRRSKDDSYGSTACTGFKPGVQKRRQFRLLDDDIWVLVKPSC